MLISLKVPKSTFKTELREIRQKCIFSTLVWSTLIKGQDSSKSHKNRCPCLSLKWVSKSSLNFQFRESRQKWKFSTLVSQTLNAGQNNSKSYKNRCLCLSLKWASKSTLKFQFQKKSTKVHIFNLGLTKLEQGPK